MGCCKALMIRFATVVASSGPWMLRSITTNSSPPSLASPATAFVGVKRLLEIEQLILGWHALADLGGVCIRKGGAEADLNLAVERSDSLRSPRAIRTRRHSHIEKQDRERLSVDLRQAYGVDRRL